MSKVAVVYWSSTGNTESMANAVADGAKEAGAEVTVFETADFEATKVDEFDAIAFGCPAMGDEVLEEDEFEPMFSSCEEKISGKKIGLFADGVICQEEPDDEAVENCKALGKALA